MHNNVSCCDDACKLINPFKVIIFMSILICICYQKWLVLCTISNGYLTLVLGVWKFQNKISFQFWVSKNCQRAVGFAKEWEGLIFQCRPFDEVFDFLEPMGEGSELILWFFEKCHLTAHMLNGFFLWKGEICIKQVYTSVGQFSLFVFCFRELLVLVH